MFVNDIQCEYDKNEHDPHYGEDQPEEQPDNTDLPENLNLNEQQNNEEEEEEVEQKEGEGW